MQVISVMRTFLFLVLVSPIICQETSRVSYSLVSLERSEDEVCSSTQNLRDNIHQDVQQRICAGGCGGPGWRRIAYLNMSDTTQT